MINQEIRNQIFEAAIEIREAVIRFAEKAKKAFIRTRKDFFNLPKKKQMNKDCAALA